MSHYQPKTIVSPEVDALVGFLYVHAVRCPQKTAEPRQLSVAVKLLRENSTDEIEAFERTSDGARTIVGIAARHVRLIGH